jgi:hypothetical protein
MGHYLDETGAIPDHVHAATGIRDHLASIVEFVTSRSITEEERSSIRCRRRPGRKPCRGWIRTRIDPESREIVWNCPVCNDRGVISGWENTQWDLSNRRTRPMYKSATRRSSVGGNSINKPKSCKLSTDAQKIWASLNAEARIRILNNVWCSSCSGSCSMELLEGRVQHGDLVLRGRGVTCGGEVARVVESR